MVSRFLYSHGDMLEFPDHNTDTLTIIDIYNVSNGTGTKNESGLVRFSGCRRLYMWRSWGLFHCELLSLFAVHTCLLLVYLVFA